MAESGGIARGDAKASDLTPGTMVGEYRIEGELGAGGMGKVYSAMHPVIAKRAAIKVLHPELSVNTEAVERFIQEARSVNQIGHPNIVDIFAFGTLPDGRSYFVMEWLRGESLRDRLDRGMPPVSETLQILDSIAIALGAAHETGIVHRDLKPDNVFLVEIKGAPSQVKLLDFGIAKLLGQETVRAERTRTGNLMGTPAYISPEQARGYAVDHRTDVYALGALAYEMLTAWLPFPADNAADMIAKHLFEPPPKASLKNQHITPEIDELIVAMMAKDAAERPSLEEVRQQMRLFFSRFLVTGPTGSHGPLRDSRPSISVGAQPTPPPVTQTGPGAISAYQTVMPLAPPRRSRAPLFAIISVLVAGLGIGAFALTRGGGSDEPKVTEPKAIEPKPAPEPTPVEPKPAPEPTPVEPPLPEPTPPEPVKPDPVKPDPKSTKPKKLPGKSAVKKPVKTKTPVIVDDPDAPM